MFVAGGDTYESSDNNYIVMAYDISTGKWTTLPPYKARDFAMTAINNQLVLVGGIELGTDEINDLYTRGLTKVLGVWDADKRQWTHPYPEMHAARAGCSVTVYNEWLVVAGGKSNGKCWDLLSSVEVMDIEREQWYAGPPMPESWDGMKTSVVGDTCYYMGGYTLGYPGATHIAYSRNAYAVSLPGLVSQLKSKDYTEEIWKELPKLQTTSSTPLSIGGSLLVVGGKNKYREAVTAIHLYQPDTGEWVEAEYLPMSRFGCTCALLNPDRGEVLVAGGMTEFDTITETVNMINVQINK